MTKSRHTLCLVAVFLLAVTLTPTPAQQEKEPSYAGKPLGEWLKQLRSGKVIDRRKAAFTLVMHLGTEGKAAVPALIEALKDNDKDVRSTVADTLGNLGAEADQAVPALLEALRDQDPSVRNAAVTSLGYVVGPGAKTAFPALLEALKDKDPFLRAVAAERLGVIGKEAGPAVPVLIEALKDKDAGVRAAAASALGGIGPRAEAAVPVLIETLKDKDPTTRASAAGALGEIGPKANKAVPSLVDALKEEHIYVRIKVVETLGKLGPEAKAAFSALLEALKGQTGNVRQLIGWALVKIDAKAAKQAGVPEPVTSYLAYIGTSPKGFERDDLFGTGYLLQGGESIHTLTLWVNGDPVGFSSTAGYETLPVNQWLRPGKNELTFSGQHQRAMYVKVAKWQGGGNVPLGMAGKRMFPGTENEGRAEALVFEVERAPKLPAREELSDRPEDRARDEKEIQALLAQLKDLVLAQKGQEAARLLHAGPLLWAETAYGLTGEEVQKEFLDLAAKTISGIKLKAADEGRPLRLLFGNRAVLAYVEPPAKGKDTRHLFAGESRGEQVRIGPLQLVRVGGKWIFWNPEIEWSE